MCRYFDSGLRALNKLSADDPAIWLDSVAEADPERLLIRTTDKRLYSYGKVADISGRFATYLSQCGVCAGDRVAAQVDKSPEGYILYLACLRMGAIFLPLNTAYSKAEMEYFISDAQPRLLVCRPESIEQTKAIAEKFNVHKTLSLGIDGTGTFIENALSCQADGFTRFSGDASDAAALLYTSGTTGRSKGAMISRRALVYCANTLAECWQFTADDILLHVLPMFHGHGLFIAGNTVLAAGAQMIFTNRFDVNEVIRYLPEATVFMGVPTMYTRLLKHPDFSKNVCRKLRLTISGSAPITSETLEAFRKRSGNSIVERYGLTETLIVTSNPCNGMGEPGSVGIPLANIDLRIADIETGVELTEPNTVGKIEVRSPCLFNGYWRNAEKTAQDMCSDGYFSTGDLGTIDEKGFLYLVGRDKDMIITGGYNVYPKEVETEIDALKNVQESTVIGLPHPDFGEAVTALVISETPGELNEASMLSALVDRLAKYKCPKKVLFVDEFPRNAMGKIQKNLLKQQYEKLYQEIGQTGN